MKAAVYYRYGAPEVLAIQDVETPVPGDNEVRVRIHATTVCAADWRMRRARPVLIRFFNGLLHPTKARILGMEFAGVVESAGASVTRFRPGDEVFGSTGFRFGTQAEYVCIAEDGRIAPKPGNMTFEEAAAVSFGGFSALHFLREAKMRAGHRVLIYGASGSVGVFAIQLAKHFGARVTGVCSSANADVVRSLGADTVVDYTREDFSDAGRIYDIILDTVGTSGFARSLRCLNPGGVYVRIGATGGIWSILGGAVYGEWISRTGPVKVISGAAGGSRTDLAFLKELIESGQLRTVIDRRYQLDDIAEAHRYAEAGHKRGHVVIVVA